MNDTSPAGAQQYQQGRPPGWTPPSALSACCSGCGARGGDRAAVADLEVTWLLPDPTSALDAIATGRFCRACRPRGDVGELACAACGDGPLLAGALAQADLVGSAAIDTWLAATGWSLALTGRAGPWCPACAAMVFPHRTHRTTDGQDGTDSRRSRR